MVMGDGRQLNPAAACWDQSVNSDFATWDTVMYIACSIAANDLYPCLRLYRPFWTYNNACEGPFSSKFSIAAS